MTEPTTKPLTIAMVAACPFPANHGGAASIREMSDTLAKFGHKVHIVTYPISENIPVGDVTIHRVKVPALKPGRVKVGPGPEKFLYNPLMVFKLISVIRRYRVDVIHAHNYEGALVGWIARLLTGRPMLYNAVNTMSDELPSYGFIKPRALAVWLGRMLDRWVPRMGDVITTVSDALRDFLIGQGIDKKKIAVLPAGVNLDMFRDGNGAAVRLRHGIGPAPLVMYTGAIEEFQRIDYLLQAMTVVAQSRRDAKLMIVGTVLNPAQRDKYLALAAGLGLSDQLLFVDQVPLEQLSDYLAAADVTVVPRPECPGHPVKLLNYMAAGRAIACFRGSAKGLRHGYNGLIAEDHDHAALGRAMLELVENPALRTQLGAQALATIDGTFDWVTLSRGIEVLYRGLVDRRASIDRTELHRYLREDYSQITAAPTAGAATGDAAMNPTEAVPGF